MPSKTIIVPTQPTLVWEMMFKKYTCNRARKVWSKSHNNFLHIVNAVPFFSSLQRVV